MALKTSYPVDLHAHTTRSDGNDTPARLIDLAAALGMRAIAITDHDVPPPETVEAGGQSVPLAEYALGRGVTVVGGYEFSCDTLVDDVHIIGLGCDFHHPRILREAENAVRSKINGYRELTERLCAHGIAVTWRDVLENQGHPRKENSVQRKQIFELIARKGHAPTWQAAKLLVRDTPAFNVRRAKPDPADAISAIHEAGGVAILAHPFLIDEEIAAPGRAGTRAAYIEGLIEAGLDGIEASYTYDKTSYKGRLSCGEIEALVRSAYGGRLPILSGGSDYHADHKKGVENPRRLGGKGVSAEYFFQCIAPWVGVPGQGG